MSIGISPTVDFAFKLMLGSPDHSRVTIHFLNAILESGPRIASIEFKNPFLGKDFDDDKLSILDILATDEHGRRLNIEMQTSLPAGLRQRLAFYDARLYIVQMLEGPHYQELRPAIVICVLSVPLLSGNLHLHSDFRLRDRSGTVLTDDLQVHLLELTKLAVTRHNLEHASSAERWAFFLSHAETMTQVEISDLFPDPEFLEAAGVLEMIKQTPEQLHQYSARLKLQLDAEARLDFARQEGRQEGREEGKLIGRVTLLQELLGNAGPTLDELSRYDVRKLTELAQQLQSQLRARGQ